MTRPPERDYTLVLDFEDREYDEYLRYNSSKKEMVATFTIDIDKEDIDTSYDVDFAVVGQDIDKDEKEFYDERNRKIEVGEVKTTDDFDWNDLVTTAIYDEDRERLEISIVLEDIDQEPFETYIAAIDVNDEEDDRRFSWDSDAEQLQVDFTIKIPEEDLEYDYDIDIKVTNSASKRVYSDSTNIDIEIKRTSDDFDWENLTSNLIYYEDTEKLEATLSLANIRQKPLFDYSVEFTLDEEDYDGDFVYDSVEDTFSKVFSLSNSSPETKYEIDIIVRDEDNTKVYEKTLTKSVTIKDSKTAISENVADASLVIYAKYFDDRELLQFFVELNNVASEPNTKYLAKLTAAGRNQERSMLYNKAKKQLSYTFSVPIDVDKVSDSYSAYLVIEDGR